MIFCRAPSFSTAAAVDLDTAAVDLGRPGDPVLLCQRRQDAKPDAPLAPFQRL